MNMELEKITALLCEKFKGERKDGLTNLAASIALFCNTDEEVTDRIDKLSAENVSAFVKDFRKNIDSENSKAVKTAEENLRKKYDLIEKNKDDPKRDPHDNDNDGDDNGKDDEIKKLISEFKNEINSFKTAQVKEKQAEKLNEILKSNSRIPDTFKKFVISSFQNQSFENEEAFNTYLETTKKDLETFNDEIDAQNLANHDSPHFGNKDADGVSQIVKDYISDKQKENSGRSI